MGDYFAEKLKTLPYVADVRHAGLLVGVELDESLNSVDVKHGCLDRRLLVTANGTHVIRMVPPLIASKDDCDKAYAILEETIRTLSK